MLSCPCHGCICRAAAAQLKPSWIREQHALWPAAFKASVKTLLLVSHRLAGSAGKCSKLSPLPWLHQWDHQC
jgi:hypothetical protein